jgi:hypothetical protein
MGRSPPPQTEATNRGRKTETPKPRLESSREAAKECSPRRKAVGHANLKFKQARKGRKKMRHAQGGTAGTARFWMAQRFSAATEAIENDEGFNP